ncbi:multiple C2 and transmembrane domain-containing protein 1 isoform X8 [Lynx canadensis]|uniref:multiple C2 and transmembrane domain-containing protein 1 isoform X8 n=1 Tax=Lynx canadensis TaxID=61383 RepID=UPI0011B023D5|nr:multiple C2 and transmembrane domain-containing protein 1 isoform X8 [Lynx canadensis]XP_042846014.1 multiple C2 and transmembrane domain-containing protein 1 isoform X7 [Panthera tigris]XP_049503533.1 multiple C2 and transmembrane domain-containing protein 1 isoform X14 [Panthera uncia]XP_060493687.1 multiple C2 and transmembrane domain-containing protein 1 isoform X15 [Panthera onca]
MEPRAAAAGSPEPAAASSSFQARLWKNLQLGVGKSKGGGGGRAGVPERRTADTPSPSPPPPGGRRDALAGVGGAGSRWSGFKKRKQVLDRVFSSSQPNLCCSSPEPLEPGGAGRTEQGSTLRRRIREHLLPAGRGPATTAAGAAGVTPPGGRSPDSAPSSSSASSSLSSSPQPPARGDRARDEGARRRGPEAHLCHQKSSSLPGTACLEQLLEPPPPPAEPAESPVQPRTPEKGEELGSNQKINTAGTSNADVPLADPGMYQLDITLRRGQSLAARDRGGTSDPYVKFKIGGKEVFRSKIIHKNLNPIWEEKACILVEHLREPLYIKVFDYDFGLQDDFMGSAFLDLTQLELNRPTDVTLTLKDPHYPDHYLGIILLSVILTPKEGEHRDVTMLMRKSWKRSSKDLSENEVVGSYFSVKSFFWRTCGRPAFPVLGFCRAELQSTYYQNAQFQTQSLRLSDVHRKSHLWRGIVSITLIEGRDLKAMDSNGLSDPYVKFRLGHQKYKSKIMPKTLNPQWREQFDFHLYEERGGIIDITAWDKDAGKRDDFIGRCQVDLSALSREQTHKLELQLEEGEGHLVLLVTLTASATVSISDLSVNSLEDQKEREEILRRYSPLRIFHNLKDVGFLQVKVIRAEGLMVADVTGKSDPFCVVELNNDRLLTHTVYKNLNPEWNKIFTFNIKDIHSVLEVTVYDEDRDRSADFLGKVAIPLLSIQNGEQKAYVLKNKQLTGPTKGVIYLEIDVIFNAVKASLRTLIPKEQKYIEEENRLSKQLLLRNFIRMKRCVMVLVNAAYYVNSCFDWDSPPRSLAAFVVVEDMLEDEEEEDDKDDKDSEKKGFINKIYAIQEVCISVQNILDEVASFGERIKNTFNWTVPFLSWLAIVALCVFTVILYFIPLRYIVLVWGINKFTKKLRSPYAIDNNELLDFLSRVPSDVQVVQYQELKPDPSHSPCKRKKNNLG